MRSSKSLVVDVATLPGATIHPNKVLAPTLFKLLDDLNKDMDTFATEGSSLIMVEVVFLQSNQSLKSPPKVWVIWLRFVNVILALTFTLQS